MASKDFTGTVFQGKIVTLVFGIAVLTLGLFSHFQSQWTKLTGNGIRTYQICEINSWYDHPEDSPWCPSIALEHYFVFVIIATFVLSLVSLITGLVAKLESAPLKHVDFGFHAISAVMLAVAGALYIVSAFQIHKIFGQPEDDGLKRIRFRKWEKVAAGVMTVIHALLYGAVALLIHKQKADM